MSKVVTMKDKKYEVRVMMYVGFGEWKSELVESFDTYEEAQECNYSCRENGMNSFIKDV